MDLRLPAAPVHFKSPSRRAGAAAEAWAAENMYCPSCCETPLGAAAVNTKVWDFRCTRCDLRVQLKAKAGRFRGSFQNSAYGPKIEAIRARALPDYALLSYNPLDWTVTDLTVVPGHFISESQVAPRNPLSPAARRAGWVGSVVKLDRLPPDAFVHVIEGAVPRPPEDVRDQYRQFGWLRERRAESAGWTADVLREVRKIAPLAGMTFTLQELYARASAALAAAYPANRHGNAKIRQQLQVLRDRGLIAFEGRGRYQVLR